MSFAGQGGVSIPKPLLETRTFFVTIHDDSKGTKYGAVSNWSEYWRNPNKCWGMLGAEFSSVAGEGDEQVAFSCRLRRSR